MEGGKGEPGERQPFAAQSQLIDTAHIAEQIDHGPFLISEPGLERGLVVIVGQNAGDVADPDGAVLLERLEPRQQIADHGFADRGVGQEAPQPGPRLPPIDHHHQSQPDGDRPLRPGLDSQRRHLCDFIVLERADLTIDIG